MPDEHEVKVKITTEGDATGAQNVTRAINETAAAEQNLTRQQRIANDALRASMQGLPATMQSYTARVREVTGLIGAPTVGPQAFGIAAAGARAAAAAPAAAVEGYKAAAVASGEVAKNTASAAKSAGDLDHGFALTVPQMIRGGAALAGFSLGLSLAAAAGRIVHDTIVSIVENQLAWERSVQQTRAVYGQMAPQIIALSQAQAQLPDVVGTQQDFLQANFQSQVLARRYGISQGTLGQLTTGGGRAASALGLSNEDARAFQQQLLGFALTGAPGNLEQYGFTVRPLDIARRFGLSSEAGLQALTPSQLSATQTNLVNQRTAQISLQGSQDVPGLLDKQRGLQQQIDQSQSRLQNLLEGQARTGGGGGGQPTALAAMTGFPSALGPYGEEQQRIEAGLAGGAPLGGGEARAALADFQKQMEDLTAQIGTQQDQLAKANAALAQLGIQANSATARLLSFTGSLEDLGSIARGDIAAAAQGGVAQRAQSVNPLIAQNPQEMLVTATQQAEQDAYRQFVARQAQQQLLQNSPIQEYLQGIAAQRLHGPGIAGQPSEQATAAQAALDDITRRRTGALAGQQAQQAGQFADRAATEANAQLQRIQIGQDERRLAVQDQVVASKRRELELAGQLSVVTLAQHAIQAQATLASGRLQSIQIAESDRRLGYADQTAQYQKQGIQIQQQMSPLLLQQAALQDRITVASRDNLGIRRELIAAQQAALPSEGALSELNYEQQRIQLQAQARQASLIRGQGGGGYPDFGTLTRQFTQGELNRPEVELQALDARQQVARAQMASTAEGLGRQMTGADLEEQARAIQDQLMPLQEAQRLEQSRSEALQQYLDLLDLEDTAAKTAAESAVNLSQQQLLGIQETLVPLQLQAELAQANSEAIQRSLDLMNLNDTGAQAYWENAVNAAGLLKVDSQEAALAAGDFASGLDLGSTSAAKIASSLERGRDALLTIGTMTEALGGAGPVPYNQSGLNLGGITVNIAGGGDTEATVNQAVAEFEVQLRQALRASGASPPPITSSLAGARRG
jgi:hypothetical protein